MKQMKLNEGCLSTIRLFVIGFLATVIMDRFWIEMGAGLRFLVNVIFFLTSVALYLILEDLFIESVKRIRRRVLGGKN